MPMICKRKRRSVFSKIVDDSDGGADVVVLHASELHCGINSPPKKRRAKEKPRFYQSIDEDLNSGTCSDEVQMFGSCDSSMCHANSAEKTCFSDEQQITSTADDRQSSNFEDLLIGLMSENECFQVISQKCGTAGVTECSREQVQTDIYRCLNETSSNSSYTDNSDSQCCVERNSVRLDRLFSRCALNSCYKPNAANSEFCTVNVGSVASKTDLSQSKTKQNKNNRWPPDYAKLWYKSECNEKKTKHNRHHTFASLAQTETFCDNSGHYTLLRKVHRMMNERGAVCGQMSKQHIAESDSYDVLEPRKKHKQLGRSKKVTKEFEDSHLTPHRKKRHHEHISSSLVNDICSSGDNQSLSSHIESGSGCADHERRVVGRMKEKPRFHQSIDDDSNRLCSHEVELFENRDSSVCHTNSSGKTCSSDQQQITSTADEQQSSIFEDLLLGMMSENECSQVLSQKCGPETAATVDHPESSFGDSDVEPDNDDLSFTLPLSCSQQNVFKKQVMLTEDCAESKDLPLLPPVKKKKKRHLLDDRMPTHTADLERIAVDKSSPACSTGVSLPVSNKCSEQNVSHTDGVWPDQDGYIDFAKPGKQQKCEKVTEVENQCAIKNEVCKSSNSGLTPCKNKSDKKTMSEYTSLTIFSDSYNVTAPLQVNNAANIQKTDYITGSSQSAEVLFGESLGYSIKNSKDLLLEDNIPEQQSTDFCESMLVDMKSKEDGFEQLLLSVLDGDKSVVSCSYRDKSGREDLVSTKDTAHVLSDSTSDDDFDDMAVTKQCVSTSVNTRPASSHTDSATYKLDLCPDKSKDKKMAPVICDGEVNKSEPHSTTNSDRHTGIQATPLAGTGGDDSRHIHVENSIVITDTESVREETLSSHYSAADNNHSQHLSSEDHPQTYDIRHHDQKDNSEMSGDCTAVDSERNACQSSKSAMAVTVILDASARHPAICGQMSKQTIAESDSYDVLEPRKKHKQLGRSKKVTKEFEGSHSTPYRKKGHREHISSSLVNNICSNVDNQSLSSHIQSEFVDSEGRVVGSIDEDSNRSCSPEVQVFENRDSSVCHTNSSGKTCSSDPQHITSTADEQQSSIFEDLLLGLMSENECSQVVSQKCGTDTAATVDHSGSSFGDSDVEPDNDDCSFTLPLSRSQQNVFKKQVMLTEHCAESKDLLLLPPVKKKKKRHRLHDRMSTHMADLERIAVDKASTACSTGVSLPVSNKCSEQNVSHTDGVWSDQDGYTDLAKLGKQQKHEKVTEVESQSAIKSEVCKSSNSGFTPCKNKSDKKTTSEYTSLSIFSDSYNVTTPPKVNNTANMQKTDYITDSGQTAEVLFGESLDCSAKNSKDLLFEDNLPVQHSTDVCASLPVHMKSKEVGFEQLLLSVLDGDKSVVSCSYRDKSCSEDFVSTKETRNEHVLSDSTSDDDFDDMAVNKQCVSTSVNTLPASSQTDSATYKLDLCPDKSMDKKMAPVICERDVNKSQPYSTISFDTSPSLLDSTLLPRFDCGMQSPVSDIDRSPPRVTDSNVTPDKSV